MPGENKSDDSDESKGDYFASDNKLSFKDIINDIPRLRLEFGPLPDLTLLTITTGEFIDLEWLRFSSTYLGDGACDIGRLNCVSNSALETAVTELDQVYRYQDLHSYQVVSEPVNQATVLHAACAYQPTFFVMLLLERISDDLLNKALTIKTDDGWTALHIAVHRVMKENETWLNVSRTVRDTVKIVRDMIYRMSIETFREIFLSQSPPNYSYTFNQVVSLKRIGENSIDSRLFFFNIIIRMYIETWTCLSPIRKDVLELLLSYVKLRRGMPRSHFLEGKWFDRKLVFLIDHINDELDDILIKENFDLSKNLDIDSVIISDHFFSDDCHNLYRDFETKEKKGGSEDENLDGTRLVSVGLFEAREGLEPFFCGDVELQVINESEENGDEDSEPDEVKEEKPPQKNLSAG